ncbi:alpha-1,4-digalacturonate transport system substrate-binding protein [Bogoriella caseilytica]|uniref:Alpha-1,4-digalacturonate transport system substrate-binding protein n=2 Tax=Bogoriella caseilytica TaxID=56055 RepID=A0A3N2BDK4_9MICO|nr:alpha-1,4-digalacturonate transport system substrate-binding protein [Bogoriella caseilytica]
MMRTRTTRLTTAAAAAALLGLAACSNGADSGDVSLSIVQSGDGQQGGALQHMADLYEEETGVQIDVVEVPNADLRTRLRNSAQAEDLPAMAFSPNIDPVWTDQMLDLTEISESAGFYPELNLEDPNDGLIKSLPSTLTAVGMFVNVDLWEEAGVEFPTTLEEEWSWDEFVDAATEVVDSTDAEFGLVMDSSAHRLRAFLHQFGSKSVWLEDGEAVTSPETATALEYFYDMHDSGFMPRSVWTAGDDPSATFKSGRVAAYYSGSWQIADFEETVTEFEWMSVPMPQQPVRATNYGQASAFVAFDGTGVEEETLDFAEWFYSAENYEIYCEMSRCLPPMEGLDIDYGDNAYAFEIYNGEIAASSGLFELQHIKHMRSNYLGTAVDSEPLQDETVRYLNDEITLDEAIENILTVTTETREG